MLNNLQHKLIFLGIALLVFAGCTTAAPPVQQARGFPVIDIVDANIAVADNSQFAIEESVWSRGPNTKAIGGTRGVKIVPKDITIHLIDTSIQVPVKNGADLTRWFLNIPAGLKATAHAPDKDAKYAAEKGAVDIIVTIDGVPTEVINQPIRIVVPYEATNRLWDFMIPPDPDKRFEVYGVEIAEIVIGGAVSVDIEPKTFKVKFGGTILSKKLDKDTNISSWFTNIPPGLKAFVAEDTVPVVDGQQAVTVIISGVPQAQVNDKIRMSVPQDITTSGIALAITPSDKAIYDIGSYSSREAKNIELQAGSNWRGVQPEWGLVGPDVFKMKDFSPVSIIQINAKSVYAIGQDGEYHWTGDSITYGSLMAEAKKLDAHAIIDVVIDSNDIVDEALEKRHVEKGHIPTALENIKLSKGIIVKSADPNGGEIYEERIRTTTRTWTGTALAIKYAPAYAPTVGDGGTTGYVPAYR